MSFIAFDLSLSARNTGSQMKASGPIDSGLRRRRLISIGSRRRPAFLMIWIVLYKR